MILKHEDQKNGACYWSADEFVVKRLSIKKSEFSTETPTHTIDGDPTDYDFGRNSDEYNSVLRVVQRETGWDFCNVHFVIKKDYSEILTDEGRFVPLIAVFPKTKRKESDVLVFSDWTWLMTDNGKTIEKLI